VARLPVPALFLVELSVFERIATPRPSIGPGAARPAVLPPRYGSEADTAYVLLLPVSSFISSNRATRVTRQHDVGDT
jgi:hypothetical protein